MLEMLVYPVSAVMRFWHWLLSGVFGADPVESWVPSIVLLVFTIRGIILPFAWQTTKSTRKSFLMRPHMTAVTEQYGKSTDPDDLEAEEAARKRIQKEHGYNPFASCVPAMIQIPMFLGLYRVLLWMAVPSAASGRRIGVLTDAEIDSFRSATFFGVPLPAYVSMSDEQFEFLGTTLDDVLSLALPLIILAIIFTTTNMLLTQVRNRTTLEWESATSRRGYYLMFWVIPFVGLSLIIGGLTGLVPVALLMYWVFNNLFTMVQNTVFWMMVVCKYPAEEVHQEHQRTKHDEYVRERNEKKQVKRSARRRRARVLVRPHTAVRVHRELRDEKRRRKDLKHSEKAEKKLLNKARKQAKKELARRQAAQRAAERAARKAQAQEGAPAPAPAPTIEGSTLWRPAAPAGEAPEGEGAES